MNFLKIKTNPTVDKTLQYTIINKYWLPYIYIISMRFTVRLSLFKISDAGNEWSPLHLTQNIETQNVVVKCGTNATSSRSINI